MSITESPIALVATLDSTRPPRYSEIDSGVANRFRKFRDQTSSRNVVVTPYMTRVKKSQNSTAPSSTGTKLGPAEVIALRYLVMNPHSTMSIAAHTNTGSRRAGLLRIR